MTLDDEIYFLFFFNIFLTVSCEKPRIFGSKDCIISFGYISAGSAVVRIPFILFKFFFGFFCETFR